MRGELIYLGCPYSHVNPDVQLKRFEAVNKAAAKLMKEGVFVFSPISHSRPLELAGGLPGDWAFWEGYDRRMISHCDRLIVLTLPGWQNSTGVNAEIKIAKELQIPVEYMHPETYAITEQITAKDRPVAATT